MTDASRAEWSADLLQHLLDVGVSLLPYIPDAGNARLVELATEHNAVRPVLLTSEEEGVAICAGVDLVGVCAALLMQSSGVGNCLNHLTLVKAGRFPILMVVSMRGDHGEQNPWQYPMGRAVEPLLHAMGVLTFRVEAPDDLMAAATAATAAAFRGGQGAALILSQRFLGAKAF